jgi:hypothetical protein
MSSGFEIIVDLKEVSQIVADAKDTLHTGLAGLLNYHKLFDRVFINQPDMRVGIK